MQEPQGEPSAQAPKAGRPDGTIDFSAYSIAQLEELKFTIDASAFPQNYSRLCIELERRQSQPPAVESACAGRFTANDGVRGWIQAKLNRSPVYGSGTIGVETDAIVIHGWRRTWLGVGHRAEVRIRPERVRNVAIENQSLEFEYKRPYRPAQRLRFDVESALAVEAVARNLPGTQTQKGWPEIREFNRRLRSVSARVWVTPSLVAANLIVFVALAIVSRRLGAFDLPVMLSWGANFGPITVNGQWWRVVTALFLHLNALHVLLNMWALWNIGRLTERLYGNWIYAFLYLASGVLASLTSVAWDPSHVSVGASGAIFGLFGSFLAFLARPGNKVPVQIARAYWLSALAFVAFNLLSGMAQAGIDNAAHVGGLISGFVLGWVLARPLGVDERRNLPVRQMFAATLVTAALAFAGVWHVVGLGAQLTSSEQYFRDHAWYSNGESENLRTWQTIANQAAAGTISDAELGRQFEKDIVPFWKTADERLKAESGQGPTDQAETATLVASFVSLRRQWASAIVEGTKAPTQDAMQNVLRLMEETDLAQARVERIAIRASMQHRPRALAESWPAADIRDFLTSNGFKCIHAPTEFGRTPASTDDAADGPAQRDKAGCLAQRLFASRRYAALDSLITEAAASLGDLADGNSTLAGIFGGLSDFTRFGSFDVQQLLGRTADWRRAVPESVYADLVETLIFENWAWAARGNGAANETSPQAWVLFRHRTELAAATLDDASKAAADTPVWYELSLGIGLDKSLELAALREIADKGIAKFPSYRPLYRGMLRILMPRWRGSYEKVNQFIVDSSQQDGAMDTEKYAVLYSIYASLERDDINIFSDASANWHVMKEGFLNLVDHYPASDALLNTFARFACITGDARQYSKLKPLLEHRMSSMVWTDKISFESCNKKFSSAPASLE